MSKVEKVIPELNVETVTKYFTKYPKLEVFIGAGTISLKAARTILDIDRYLMYDIYCDLISAGAITSSGNNGFRATPALLGFLETRK